MTATGADEQAATEVFDAMIPLGRRASAGKWPAPSCSSPATTARS
jgi:hypothetical protein